MNGERNKVHDGKFKVKTIFSANPNARIKTFKNNIIDLDSKIINDAIAKNWLQNSNAITFFCNVMWSGWGF
jgi:hypothetical protein